jgi:septal ring-binding cell division protein DamX
VQLLSLGSAPSAQAFIDKRKWRLPVGYVEVVRSGKSYFCVVYGSFKTKVQAQAAAQALPAKSRGAGKPWIRRMEGVQAYLP